MGISLYMLADMLKREYCVLETKLDIETLVIDTVLVMAGNNCFKENTVTIGWGTSFIPDPYFKGKCAVICVGKLPVAYKKSRNCDYILISEEENLKHVINSVQKIYSYYNAHFMRLYDICFQGRGLQDLFDEAVGLFNNPIYYHDDVYRIIAGSVPKGAENIYDLTKDGFMTPAEIRLLKDTQGYADTYDSEGVIMWKGTLAQAENWKVPEGNGNYMYCNIRRGERVCGRVFVDEILHPLTQADRFLLEQIAHLVTVIVNRRAAHEKIKVSVMDEMLGSILRHETVDRIVFERSLRAKGMDVGDSYIVTLVGVEEKQEQDFTSVYSFCGYFQEAIPHSYFFPIDKEAVGIVKLNGDIPEAIYSELEKNANVLNVRVGISKRLNNIYKLSQGLEQARFALREDKRNGLGQKRVCFFENELLDYFLYNCCRSIAVENLCPQGLHDLMTYDGERNTQLVETWRVYLENCENQSQTAEALFISRSAFLYRLRKIREIMGDDFDNPDVKLCCRIWFELKKAQKRREHRESY